MRSLSFNLEKPNYKKIKELYDKDKIEERLKVMHDFEHTADGKRHDLTSALSKSFITPLEREDLEQLSSNLDEVADNIEAVIQRFYIDEPQVVTEESIEFAKKILASCDALIRLCEELPNFKKPAKLSKIIVEINDLEEECDEIYLKALKSIRKNEKDVLSVLAWSEIYEYLEKCVDSCENIGDIVSSIVMKNS